MNQDHALAGIDAAALSTLLALTYRGPQEQLQVYASRATGSLMLLRGEGFQKSHQARLETDIQALAAALQSLPQSSDALRSSHAELVT